MQKTDTGNVGQDSAVVRAILAHLELALAATAPSRFFWSRIALALSRSARERGTSSVMVSLT